MSRLKRAFAKQEDPYAGADLPQALRLGALLWVMGIALLIPLWALSPPDRQIGGAGWLIALGLAASGLAWAYVLRANRFPITFWMMLASAYGATAGLAVMNWLAGGWGPPYTALGLLPVIYVAAIHPLRRIGAFMLFMALALASPLLYDGWNSDGVATATASFVAWAAIAAAGYLMMSGVRAQRLTLRREGKIAREQAREDQLTGLGNRRAFDEAIDVEIARARRMQMPLSAMLLDIERFKEINDRWGHVEGDRCLREVASALRTDLRRPDLCFRWGGDEFALVLAGTDREGGLTLAARIAELVADACRRPDGDPIVVRCGLAELEGDMSSTELMELADIALLTEKSRSELEGERPVD
ncbi:MAG: diguanylate cyclase [Actinomycetota bacterium]